MKKVLFLILLVVTTEYATAQYNETIRTARPGQAVGPFTTGKKVFQVQSGLTYGAFDISQSPFSGQSQQFFTSLRYGLTERFEVRSAFALQYDQQVISETQEQNFGGLSAWNVGVRYNLLSGEGYQPSLGIQTDFRLTWVDEDYQAQNIAPRIMLIHSQKLSELFSLTTNWAVVWSGNNGDPAGTGVVNLSFPLTEKLGSFVETYGVVANGDLDLRYDTGLGFLVNNDLLLDISAGFGVNDDVFDWFIDGGISWRIKFK